MSLILTGIGSLIGCTLIGEYGAGIVCMTIGFCLQYVVDELIEIKNKLK